MNEKIIDKDFGEMTFKHGWFKEEEIDFLGKKWKTHVVAKAYSGRSITDKQRESYRDFTGHRGEYVNKIEDLLISYISSEDFREDEDIKINKENLSEHISPKTVLFKQDGTVVMLLDCDWDVENGIGVRFIPEQEIKIGVQDLFL